ncbi:hypothetical protein LCGC14_1161540 [marine sediment metagenome]|uniref:Uncharacterized protein n=1 Tax=marine sediment metagenome TaxID=412755 RepID=A0A0F9LSB4_9ZZZZ
MQKFSDIEKKYQLENLFRSRRGYLYIFKPALQDEMVIRHFNGELKPNFTKVFAEVVERINQWVTSHKLLHEYVEVELVREVGEDFIILLFHKSYSTLSAIEDWDDYLVPEELEIMQNILRSEIGNPRNDKEKIIEEILVRSLLEPSGKTWFYETINKFIITEPRITQEHLEKWSNLSNEQS